MRQKNKILLVFVLILSSLWTYAQKPREVQVDNEPPYWDNPATIIVIIAIPLLMLIFGIIWYQRRKKKLMDIQKELRDED